MRKKLGLVAIALTIGSIASIANFNTTRIKAITQASEYAYGSWQKNEDIASHIKGEDSWWVSKTDYSFELNGVTWTFNYGRANTANEKDYKFELVGFTKNNEGVIDSHSILEYTENDDIEFYSLGQKILSEEKAEYGNHLSAIYSSPILFKENINIYLRNRYGGEFGSAVHLYFKAVDSDVTHIPDGSNVEEIIYEKDTWQPFYIDKEFESTASLNATGIGTGTGVKGDYNECALEFNTDSNWKLSYLKGHEVRLAIVYYTWAASNPRFPNDDAMTLVINDVVVNSTDATIAMLNSFASREPNSENLDRNICNWITTKDNYFGLTLRSTQKNLTNEGLEILASTSVEGQYTSCSNCLELLNYLNSVSGININYSNLIIPVAYTPAVLIVSGTIFAVLTGCSFAFIKRRRINKTN